MLATRVFHEDGTKRRFKYKSVASARQRLGLNPEWVEALMGFPTGWTKAVDTCLASGTASESV
jgi:hypothetical protein